MQSILFIGLFMTLTFCFGFLSFVGQAKMQFRSTCINESVGIQKKIIFLEKKLFALNPLSTALQLDYDVTIAASEMTGILVPVSAALKAEAALIRAEQIQLDLFQRGLIKSAEILILVETTRVESKMLQDSSRLSQAWTFFLQSFYKVVPSHRAHMAVRARTSGIAPNYELKPNYREEQKVAFLWQLKYSTKSKAQKVLESENNFELECQASPLEKGNSWSIEI